jgi:hypothetical protein
MGICWEDESESSEDESEGSTRNVVYPISDAPQIVASDQYNFGIMNNSLLEIFK